MARKIKECPVCGESRPWQSWWMTCPDCRKTTREEVDPADLVDSFEELLTVTCEAARAPRAQSARPDQRILANIRAEKERLGEGTATSYFPVNRASERWRARGVRIRWKIGTVRRGGDE